MTISELNRLPASELCTLLSTCCGSSRWTEGMSLSAPFKSETELYLAADRCWSACGEKDWLEAFLHHPKIGDLESLKKKFASTQHLASSEQGAVTAAPENILAELKSGNDEYEKRFGFIFIVCATGKSAEEMLELLRRRINNDRDTELRIAAAEQHKITLLRLKKLVA